VQAAWAEPDAPPETAAELAAELALMAGWLGLERVEVRDRGDLAPALRAATRSRPGTPAPAPAPPAARAPTSPAGRP